MRATAESSVSSGGRHAERACYLGRRTGLTLLELLIAMSIMVMAVGTLGVLAKGVQDAFSYGQDHGEATQHARVALERIAAKVREAAANKQFPGIVVLADRQAKFDDVSVDEQEYWRFPDTLVVWYPRDSDGNRAEPSDPDGLPRYNELVIYCPNPGTPNELMEIFPPADDDRTIPKRSDYDDLAAWKAALKTEIDAIKRSSLSKKVVLTPLLRTAFTGRSTLRGAVRFHTRLRPSEVQWSQYESGDLDFEELDWVQGLYGPKTGLRQVWIRTELQLVPGEAANAGSPAVPFLGSAALYYELHAE